MNYIQVIQRSKYLTFFLFCLIFTAAPSIINFAKGSDPDIFFNFIRASLLVGFIVFVVLRKRF